MSDTDDRYIRLPFVVEKTGHSRSTIYRLVAAGKFPKQVAIGRRSVGWRLSAVLKWMDDPTDYDDDPPPDRE